MPLTKRRIWTIGGGNGCVGKSFLTAAVAVSLAREGKTVVAIDADLRGSNLHNYFGIRQPEATLLDMLEGRVGPEAVALETPEPGLSLVSSAGSILGIANPLFAQKETVIRFISRLSAEYLVVDLGSGTLPNMLDFFNMSDEGIVLVSPDPTSMQNAYEFIRSAICRHVYRKLSSHDSVNDAIKRLEEESDSAKPWTMMELFEQLCDTDPEVAECVAALVDTYRPHLLVNMASSPQDLRVAEIVQSACKKFLNADVRCCGLVGSDPLVLERRMGLDLSKLGRGACTAIDQICEIVRGLAGQPLALPSINEQYSQSTAAATPIMGLNDNLTYMGIPVHVQTEDMGQAGRCISTQVFREGEIILSRKLEYPSVTGDDAVRVMDLMRNQHFNIIQEIRSGKIIVLVRSGS